jgi:hypothetical protein
MGDDWHIRHRRHLDRNRGIQADKLAEALGKAVAVPVDSDPGRRVSVNPPHTDLWPREPGGTDPGDPYGYAVKPAGTPVWSRPPATPEEEALYYGVHLHSESNPLGLHTHVPGGELRGGHSHSPQNRFGSHHHSASPPDMAGLDGKHTHDGKHYPDGCHEHHPDNFG